MLVVGYLFILSIHPSIYLSISSCPIRHNWLGASRPTGC